MSTLKARFTSTDAQALLEQLYPEVHDLEPLSGGEASRAYGFVAGDRRLVLRANHHAPYDVDAWISERLAGTPVPAPRVLRTGRHGRHHWAISERAPGSILDAFDMPTWLALRASLVDTLATIHAAPIADTSGYGWLAASGNAAHATWHEFLSTDGRYGTFLDWDHVRAVATPRQRKLFDAAWEISDLLIPNCPEERVFLHGDYSSDNILSDGDRLTGVIDWSNALYGDPLWDVAWMDIWAPGFAFAPAWLEAYPAVDAQHRILCYQVIFAACAIGFGIQTEQPDANPWIEEQLELRLQAARALLAADA